MNDSMLLWILIAVILIVVYLKFAMRRSVSPDHSQQCPNCGLQNPSSAMLCDCGYNFETASGGIKVDKRGDFLHGPINPQLICPHCQTKGSVRTKMVKAKRGISGGKATAAVLTAGFSILATGLSRKESCTEAHCENCNSTWIF